MEKKKQETNAAHSLHGQVPAERRLKRECFLSSVRPADFPAKVIRCSEWQHRQNLSPHNCAVNLDESLAKGHTSPCAAWRCLNRLRTGVACSKEQLKRWKYFNGDTTCECGQAPETTKHMLQCPLLAHPCTLDDLQKFNENARKWKNAVDDTKEEDYVYKNTHCQMCVIMHHIHCLFSNYIIRNLLDTRTSKVWKILVRGRRYSTMSSSRVKSTTLVDS